MSRGAGTVPPPLTPPPLTPPPRAPDLLASPPLAPPLTPSLTNLSKLTCTRSGTPAPLETLTPLERRASVAVHHSLMALIILMPLIGWLMTSAYRVDVSVFGLFTLPHLMPKSEPIFDALAAAHKWLGLLMAALILSHIGAAIMHTFIKRDGVLQRMLPASRD
jgi:cytochrome b561